LQQWRGRARGCSVRNPDQWGCIDAGVAHCAASTGYRTRCLASQLRWELAAFNLNVPDLSCGLRLRVDNASDQPQSFEVVIP